MTWRPATGGNYSTLMPITIYTEHTNLVTCLAAPLGNSNIFVSGGWHGWGGWRGRGGWLAGVADWCVGDWCVGVLAAF